MRQLDILRGERVPIAIGREYIFFILSLGLLCHFFSFRFGVVGRALEDTLVCGRVCVC